MIAKADFLRAERDALHRFMRKHVIQDFLSGPNGGVAYSRRYRCECGFQTSDAEEIFDHVHQNETV
jgi:hypothetical protein